MKILKLLRMSRLLKIDNKKGHILTKGVSVLILPVDVSSSLNKGLAKIVGKSVAAPLYHSGKELGNSIFGLFIKIYGRGVKKSEEKFKKAIEDFLPLGGFGKIEVIEVDFKNGKYVFRGFGLPEVISITDSKDPVCHLMRGISTGFVEKVINQPCVGKENKCQAKGDEYCEFEINREA